MDRFDELLLKARAEMMGQTPVRNEISKQDAFDMAWDITKRRTRMGMGFAQRAKEAEAKRQAKEAKRQAKANRPSLLDRMKSGYRSVRPPQQSTPTEDPNFVDFMGQQGGLEAPSPARTQRVSGSPPGFVDFMGQQGGLEAPKAIQPNEVPMREDINTEQPVETESARGVPPSVEPRNLPMRQPRGGVPAVRGKAPATEPLPPSQLPMRRPAGALPERTGATPPPRGSRRNQRSPLAVRQPRPDIKEQQLPSKQRRAERKRRNTAADKVEAERTPAPQPEPQVEEQSEPVKPPQPPQVEEQTTKKPPTAKQTTLFGGEEQTAPAKPKEDNATVEAAQKRKANRAKKNQPQEQEEKLPSINSMTDISVLNELMNRAEDGDEKARKHLYNRMGDLEDHHPSVAERYKDTFENMVQDANLSLLPSGMRQSILKENNADVNYSLLPNGWV